MLRTTERRATTERCASRQSIGRFALAPPLDTKNLALGFIRSRCRKPSPEIEPGTGADDSFCWDACGFHPGTQTVDRGLKPFFFERSFERSADGLERASNYVREALS